jgi:hypothetical protein
VAAASSRFFLSGSWKNDEGVIPNTGFEKQGLRLNLERRLSERLTISLNTNLLHTDANRGLTNNDNSAHQLLDGVPVHAELRGPAPVRREQHQPALRRQGFG